MHFVMHGQSISGRGIYDDFMMGGTPPLEKYELLALFREHLDIDR